MASSQTKFYGALAVIAVGGAALIGYVALQGEPGSSAGTTNPASVTPANPDELVGPEVGVSLGSEDAPVVIEEYVDYECPYCAMITQLTVPDIVERYVETGKVRYIVFDFPVHPGERPYVAAEATRCARDQGAFWQMHELLFARMREWTDERDPRGMFQGYARALGLDDDAFRDCLDSREYREEVLLSRRRGQQQGVSATPTLIINGRARLTGAVSFDSVASVIEEELARP